MNIILTATINCGNCPSTIEKNPIKRESWYLNTVEKYLKNTNLDLIFVENSNYPLDKFKNLFGESERLEILSFKGNKNIEFYGKGQGEKEILHHALENSHKLKNQNYFYKISGRYCFIDFEQHIVDMQKENLLSVNFSIKGTLERPTFTSVIFGCDKELFKNFFPKTLILRDGHKNFEDVYMELLKSINSNNIKILPNLKCEKIQANHDGKFNEMVG